MIRDVLLAIYGTGWLLVMGVTALRGSEIQPELWAALGLGVGAILAAFRTDERVGRSRPANGDQGDPE